MKAVKSFSFFRTRKVAEETKPVEKSMADIMKEAARGKFEIQGSQPVVNMPAVELPTVTVAGETVIDYAIPAPAPEAASVVAVSEPTDKVEIITPPAGEPIVSVSRMRVVVIPQFWSHFRNNIHRVEVVAVVEGDFKDMNCLDVARGWHHCTMNGMDGVLHVTKKHVSAVFFVDDKGFCGISTSPSRFNSHGLIDIDADRAKAYLNGH